MSCISINDIELLNVLLTALTLIVALLGIQAWKKQLKGSFSFTKNKELSLELNKFIYHYNNIISEFEAILEVFEGTTDKKWLQTMIGESLEKQLDTSNKSIESIRLLILEISPIDKKDEYLWNKLNNNLFVFCFWHKNLAEEIKEENITHDEIMKKVAEFLERIKDKLFIDILTECNSILTKNLNHL